MKNVLFKITIVMLLLLTALILVIGAYIGVPSFREKIDSRVSGISDNVTVVRPVDSIPHTIDETVVPGAESVDPFGASTDETEEEEVVPASEDRSILANDIRTDYIAPSESSLMIPEDMLGRLGGYEEIKPEYKTLEGSEADFLENSLGEGNTGDGLTFDPLMYPYYSMLDDVSKHLYRQIYANAGDLYGDFKAVENDISKAQLDNAFVAVISDHPELFYMDTKYSAGFRDNGRCIEIKLYFNKLANDIDSSKAAFESAAASVKSSDGSPYETEKAAHNALANMDRYMLASPNNQSAYSALVDGYTVCAGYSRAFQYVMQLADIPCYYCSGYAGENHAWNIICLDNEFYNVDVTWDDTDSNPAYNYDWFNKSDSDYGSTHIRKGLSVYLPPCNGNAYSNLEPDPASEEVQETVQKPKTLEDYGLDESDVIYDIRTYYDRCLEEASKLGTGDHELILAVNDKKLCEKIRDAFTSGSVDNGLLSDILSAAEGSHISMSVYPVQLDDGRYVLEHSYSMR